MPLITPIPRRKLRYALIGCGAAIAEAHIEAIGELAIDVVAASDIDRERGARRARDVDCRFFTDHRELLREARPDAAIICTPHPAHAEQANDCFAARVHVLVEKPMAVDVADADRMIAAAERAGRVLAVNFQERFRPAVEHARRFIAAGELGELLRVLSVEPWLRTAAYYRSSPWRGTWRGEGGGVLMNQAPHTLDTLCYLVGMPARVWGMARTRGHAIEVEDSAQAMLEYPNGAFGYVTVSTVEAGTERRLEIIGDRAVLKLVGDELTIVRFDPPLSIHIAAGAGAAQPAAHAEAVRLRALEGPRHRAVHRDFYEALRRGRAPACDGRGGLMSLELANAILLSSFTDAPVHLPLDRAAYGRLLADLKRSERASSSGGE